MIAQTCSAFIVVTVKLSSCCNVALRCLVAGDAVRP